MPYGVCKVCGCTDNDPCHNPRHGNCWWADDTHELCSHCADPEIANDPETIHCINSHAPYQQSIVERLVCRHWHKSHYRHKFRQFGYEVDPDSRDIYYFADTVRHPIMERNAQKYGFKILPAEDTFHITQENAETAAITLEAMELHPDIIDAVRSMGK